MDSEENEEIFTDNSNFKRKRREKYKIKINSSFNNNSIINMVKLITLLIILFLIIYIFNSILLFKEKQNFEKIKSNIIMNKNNNINIQKTENIIIENKENNTENIEVINNISQSKNISLNITEEIEQFVQTLKKVDEKEIAQFRKDNSEKILYNKTECKRSENPDISIILTMSNQAHCIHKALRSIQNQSLKNIEIIISLDCSLDNSTETILSYMKEDERIILIYHDANEGTMKNRIDGFRKAKGKYVTVVDGDDALIQKDILKNALYIANLGNIDIVEFFGNMYQNEKYKGIIHYHKINGIIKQPELRTIFFDIKENNEKWRPIVCRTIWGKLIKNDIMQKAIEIIGPKYTDDYMMWYEDTTIVVTLYQIAQSFYLFKEAGYYYSRDEFNGRYPTLPFKKCKQKGIFNIPMDALKFINYIYENFEDNEIERQTIYHEILAVHAYDFSKFTKITGNYDMLYRIFDGMNNSKYLTEKEKERLTEIKNEVIKTQNNQK